PAQGRGGRLRADPVPGRPGDHPGNGRPGAGAVAVRPLRGVLIRRIPPGSGGGVRPLYTGSKSLTLGGRRATVILLEAMMKYLPILALLCCTAGCGLFGSSDPEPRA